jgi:CAAX protease family protein
LRLFLMLVLGASAAVEILIARAGGIRHAGSLVALVMCLPGLSAVAALLITNRSVRGIGWHLGAPRYFVFAALFPLAIVTPVYLAATVLGFSTINTAGWVHVANVNFGVTNGPWISLIYILAIGLMLDSIVAAGEEIGWRGLLLTELAKRIPRANAALITGVIWALWHYPGILFGGYASPTAPIAYSLVCFTIMALGWSMVLAWLRFASGSFWPAALMHGAHNLLIQAVFAGVTRATGPALGYVVGEFGVGVAICYAAAGFLAWRRIAR